MGLRRPLIWCARLAATRTRAVLAVTLLLALGGGVLALGLTPSTGVDTLVSSGSDSARATQEYHDKFGDDAIVVLVREELPNLVDTADLGRLIKLEGCLGGNVPKGTNPYGAKGGPCWRMAQKKYAKVVYGPGTFLLEATNEVARQLNGRLAQAKVAAQRAQAQAVAAARKSGASKKEQQAAGKAAAQQAQSQFVSDIARLAVQTGIQGLPRIDNASFVNQIVFDPQRGAYVPKARFAYLFPSKNAALVQLRLKPGLSDNARRDAIKQVRAAVKMPLFKLGHKGAYTVTGAPVVAGDLAARIGGAMALLLGAAVVVMALVLFFAFRLRPRLLPLGIALGAAGIVFGLMRLAGATLTMATVAVLPVLIGLAVDYAIQFQTRVDEEGGDPERAAARGGPTIATAGIATAVGFLVLLVSPVPMVRGFGLILVFGIVVALATTFLGGSAALTALRGRPPGRVERTLAPARAGAVDILASVPGARPGATRVRGWWGRGLAAVLRRPERALAIGAAVALLGWVADTQTTIQSDVTKLVPQDLPALRDLDQLQKSTGISGEIDVVINADDITRPDVVAWMTRYQQRVLKKFDYTAQRGCGRATLCPALSLPDLFSTTRQAASSAQIRRLLAAVPPYFSRSVITADRKSANLAFGIRLLPLDRQQEVVDAMRRDLDPPKGVTARLAGLPVLAAEANDRLSDPLRRLGTLLLGLLLVGVALWAVFRDARRAIVPLIPIALATGWAALVVAPLELNPMSATLGALVIAISTEFSVLLSERFRQERLAGHDPDEALRRTYASTGRAVVISSVTAIAGFAVLALSDIAMVRNFGLVTVIDLAVALLGVLLVLPAVLVLAERGELETLPRRAVQAVRGRVRRRRPTTA